MDFKKVGPKEIDAMRTLLTALGDERIPVRASDMLRLTNAFLAVCGAVTVALPHLPPALRADLEKIMHEFTSADGL
jgi:hypothetical protein